MMRNDKQRKAVAQAKAVKVKTAIGLKSPVKT
jgi:hypothetical protein